MNSSALLFFLLCLAGVAVAEDGARWHIERVPEGGIQPRLVLDTADKVHLLYFQFVNRDTRRGHYVHRTREENGDWSDPVRVSDVPLSHNDAIGKAAFAVDDRGRIHVVWFPGDGYYYARSTRDGTAFESPRRVVTGHTNGIEAEAAIAVTDNEVTITWHAGDMADEASRQVYIVRSIDGGDHFGAETAISDASLGACACCTLATGYDNTGEFVYAYRSAIKGTGRHLQLVTSTSTQSVGDWIVDTCPVSSNIIKGDWLVYETQGVVMCTSVNSPAPISVAPSTGNIRQKHPDVAINSKGERMVVWGEANGYVRGGQLRAQFLGSSGSNQKMQPDTSGMTIADFSVVATTALPDDSFLILY